MIITALLALGADPSFVNGGVIESLDVSSAWGTGDSDMYRYAPFCDLVTVCNTLRHLERTITDILDDAS